MNKHAPQTLWRTRELVSSVLVLTWAGFHLWEQWSAFGGRAAFVRRMSGTSLGGVARATELALGVAPIFVWLALEAWLVLRHREPQALRLAMAEEPALAERLGWLVRVGSWLLLFFLVVHVVWLFVPKLFDDAGPLDAWLRLREEAGTWPLAVVHALGLTGLALHVWAAPVRLGVVLDGLPTPEARRAARLSGFIVAVAITALLAQLVGWHTSGFGTVWSM